METINRKPSTVGEILQEEFLTPLGISQAELAQSMGVNRATINRLCNGHRRLTVEDATSLAELFETTTDFWLNLQAAHDRWEARQVNKNRPHLPPIMQLLGRRISPSH